MNYQMYLVQHLKIYILMMMTIHLSERMRIITYMEPQFENPIHTQGFIDRVSHIKSFLNKLVSLSDNID